MVVNVAGHWEAAVEMIPDEDPPKNLSREGFDGSRRPVW